MIKQEQLLCIFNKKKKTRNHEAILTKNWSSNGLRKYQKCLKQNLKKKLKVDKETYFQINQT